MNGQSNRTVIGQSERSFIKVNGQPILYVGSLFVVQLFSCVRNSLSFPPLVFIGSPSEFRIWPHWSNWSNARYGSWCTFTLIWLNHCNQILSIEWMHPNEWIRLVNEMQSILVPLLLLLTINLIQIHKANTALEKRT